MTCSKIIAGLSSVTSALTGLRYPATLANVCRHGDGPSLRWLSVKCPELSPPMPGSINGSGENPFRVENILISLDILDKLTDAIQSFWNQAEYIYLESLSRKHENVMQKLERLRPT